MNKSIFTYEEFYEWILELVLAEKTSGSSQSPALANFTALNAKRMSRLSKTVILQPELMSLLQEITELQEWLVITEAWCGDSAQSLPVIARMAAASDNINLKIVLREENPELMDQYLTNGSKSIPKLVSFDQSGNEIFTWGPRPEPAQKILMDWKREPAGRSWEIFEKELHTWYALDKSVSLQGEFVQILEKQEV
ncbi:thioredoxin family protein [Salegentibacter sp. JZCK2]|uniref:thioredoxin family protein n=1 Tax=Salegentibacter tibetensis TaxID=2873600 RepID=UPI001CCCCB82|nr:thioredoxin family protein [Salegentibacter tibetensis]MBZ9731595.1 thioredoxin family protein [Salegentibacter tibetensis]